MFSSNTSTVWNGDIFYRLADGGIQRENTPSVCAPDSCLPDTLSWKWNASQRVFFRCTTACGWTAETCEQMSFKFTDLMDLKVQMNQIRAGTWWDGSARFMLGVYHCFPRHFVRKGSPVSEIFRKMLVSVFFVGLNTHHTTYFVFCVCSFLFQPPYISILNGSWKEKQNTPWRERRVAPPLSCIPPLLKISSQSVWSSLPQPSTKFKGNLSDILV